MSQANGPLDSRYHLRGLSCGYASLEIQIQREQASLGLLRDEQFSNLLGVDFYQ